MVVEAVSYELGRMKVDPKQSADAATALVLATQLDEHNSATSKALCAKQLGETMQRLRMQAPREEKRDQVDDLRTRRAKRRRSGA